MTHSLIASCDGIVYMISSISSSMMILRPRAPTLRLSASSAIASSASSVNFSVDVLEAHDGLVLPHERVLRLAQDLDERALVELVERGHDRQTADELRDQAELDEVLGMNLREQLAGRLLFLRGDLRAEAHRRLRQPALDDVLQPDERAAADEEDVRGVDLDEFLVRMLASALRRNVGDGAFEDLQQRLLHAFAADVARDRRVVALAADLVDFVDVDDAALRLLFVVARGLVELEDDVLDVLADVARPRSASWRRRS